KCGLFGYTARMSSCGSRPEQIDDQPAAFTPRTNSPTQARCTGPRSSPAFPLSVSAAPPLPKVAAPTPHANATRGSLMRRGTLGDSAKPGGSLTTVGRCVPGKAVPYPSIANATVDVVVRQPLLLRSLCR